MPRILFAFLRFASDCFSKKHIPRSDKGVLAKLYQCTVSTMTRPIQLRHQHDHVPSPPAEHVKYLSLGTGERMWPWLIKCGPQPPTGETVRDLPPWSLSSLRLIGKRAKEQKKHMRFCVGTEDYVGTCRDVGDALWCGCTAFLLKLFFFFFSTLANAFNTWCFQQAESRKNHLRWMLDSVPPSHHVRPVQAAMARTFDHSSGQNTGNRACMLERMPFHHSRVSLGGGCMYLPPR